ncbi:ssDNA binding protein [Gordonia phage Wojtek]|uniref:SsDNA binding protein n=1 Tax=Gordonia phage Wojtek TaxID=2910758 RepID=A0AA49BR43_9CAUD|nr:ssDNA binding protein [Gordonia phage Wojtek]
MSRFIDDNKPFTEEDIEYLQTRPDGEYRISLNQARFGDLSDEEKSEVASQKDADDEHDAQEAAEYEQAIADSELEFDDDVIAKVEPLSYNELRQAAKKHDLDAGGTKEELQDRLLEFYQEQKEASTTVPVIND